MLVSKVWDSYQSRDWNFPLSLSQLIAKNPEAYILWPEKGIPIICVKRKKEDVSTTDMRNPVIFDALLDAIFDVFEMTEDGLFSCIQTGIYPEFHMPGYVRSPFMRAGDAFEILRGFIATLQSVSTMNDILKNYCYEEKTDGCMPTGICLGFNFEKDAPKEVQEPESSIKYNHNIFMQSRPFGTIYNGWGWEKSLAEMSKEWDNCTLSVNFSRPVGNSGLYPIILVGNVSSVINNPSDADYYAHYDEDNDCVVNTSVYMVGIREDGFVSLHNTTLQSEIGALNGTPEYYIVGTDLSPEYALESAILLRNLIKEKDKVEKLVQENAPTNLQNSLNLSLLITEGTVSQIEYQNQSNLLQKLREISYQLHCLY